MEWKKLQVYVLEGNSDHLLIRHAVSVLTNIRLLPTSPDSPPVVDVLHLPSTTITHLEGHQATLDGPFGGTM